MVFIVPAVVGMGGMGEDAGAAAVWACAKFRT